MLILRHSIRHGLQAGISKRSFSMQAQTERSWVLRMMGDTQLCQFMEKGLVFLHDDCHLPWWATLLAGSVSFRAITFPFSLVAERMRADRFQLDRDVRSAIKNKVNLPDNMTQREYKALNAKAKFITGKVTQIEQEYEDLGSKIVFNRSGVLMLFSAGLYICLSVAIRKIFSRQPGESDDEDSSVTDELTEREVELGSEGLLWSKNLLKSDVWYGWPLCTFVLSVLLSRVGRFHFPLMKKKFTAAGAFRMFSWRVIAVVIFTVSCFLPAALPYFWTTALCLTLIQNCLFQHPVVKGFLRIKSYPWDTRQPFRSLFKKPWKPPPNAKQ